MRMYIQNGQSLFCKKLLKIDVLHIFLLLSNSKMKFLHSKVERILIKFDDLKLATISAQVKKE